LTKISGLDNDVCEMLTLSDAMEFQTFNFFSILLGVMYAVNASSKEDSIIDKYA